MLHEICHALPLLGSMVQKCVCVGGGMINTVYTSMYGWRVEAGWGRADVWMELASVVCGQERGAGQCKASEIVTTCT